MAQFANFGTASQDLGPNFQALNIEVRREGVRQRLVSVVGSYLPVQKPGGVVTPIDDTIVGRLVVYRGSVTELDDSIQWNAATTVPWPSAIANSGLRPILDVFVPWHATGFAVDFTRWPDALVQTEPGEPLGAFMVCPVYANQRVLAFACACLTLQGMDADPAPEGRGLGGYVAR